MGFERVKRTMSFLSDELNELKSNNLFRNLFVLDTPQQAVSVINGKKVVNLSSNNYLGLTTHPRVTKAAKEAIDRWGAGTSAVRTIIGTMDIHEQLEKKLAAFKGTEAALVLQSGFATNVACVQTLMSSEEDFIVSDELNHASIIDGCRLAKAQRKVFKHKNYRELEEYCRQARANKARRILISTDGVFSMDGDIADLPAVVEVAEKYDAIVLVDDAHATGVLGKNGRGTPSHFELTERVHVQIGTLSKTIGAMGGYIGCTKEFRDYMIHKARPFLFSSSHPPAVVAACMAAIDVLSEEPQWVERLWANTKYFKERMKDLGFDLGASVTPITPVIVGDTAKTMRLSDRLFEEGVFAQGIGYPTVAKGKERIRCIVTATHSKDDLDFAIKCFRNVGTELGITK